MMHPRILVTGATGRIGSAVTAQLLQQGITTRALVHRDNEHIAPIEKTAASA